MAVALMPRSVRRSPESALTVLYDRHAAALLSFARSYVGDTAAAEDVVQQTFLAAHRTLNAGTQLEHPRAWLFHVARNNALLVLRERGGPRAADAVLTEELEARATQVSEQVEERDELRSVVADIVALPADQRAALTLFALADLSQAEIATAIGVEQTKVKALVFQARSALTDQRAARDASCASVREKLATLSGGARNSRLIRHHLRQCPGCTAYRDELRDGRRKLALLLPLPLLPGLREAVLGKGAAAAATATAGHTGAAAWLTGRTRWLAAGGSTAAAGAVVAVMAIGGGGPAKRAVEPAAAAAVTPAPKALASTAQPVTPRQTRTRTSPRTVRTDPPPRRTVAVQPAVRRTPPPAVEGGRAPERTRDAPPSPERPAPSVTPAPSSTPEAPPASAPEPEPAPTAEAVAPASSPAPTSVPAASSEPASSPTVWPPGHRDKGDDHPPNHPPHP